MVQLSLMADANVRALEQELERLEQRARARLLPSVDIRSAVSAARARFRAECDSPLDARQRTRVDAYFNAVLRRRILSSSEPLAASARRRIVAASIEADLLEGGWDRARAAHEASRLAGF